jgi:hypothetical protein
MRLWCEVPLTTIQSRSPGAPLGCSRLRVSRQCCESVNPTIMPLLPPLETLLAAPEVVMSSPSSTTCADLSKWMAPALTTARPRLAARTTMGAASVPVRVMTGKV